MRVAVITAGRSDRGLLDILIDEMHKHDCFDVSVIATGESTQGDVVVDMLLGNDSREAASKGHGLGTLLSTDALRAVGAELVVVLGDRYEVHAACVTATHLGIPIAHLHGGERTLGSLDDIWRDCITMMAVYHFTAHEEYEARVRAMGARGVVYNTGALALDRLPSTGGSSTAAPFVIVSVPEDPAVGRAVAAAVKRLGVRYIWLPPNADAGRDGLAEFVNSSSMSRDVFIRLLAQAACIVGNSSCGIYEAHAVHTPAVNVGDRQKGRVRPFSVIDVPVDVDAIADAIKRAMTWEVTGDCDEFGDGHAAERIVEVLKCAC